MRLFNYGYIIPCVSSSSGIFACLSGLAWLFWYPVCTRLFNTSSLNFTRPPPAAADAIAAGSLRPGLRVQVLSRRRMAPRAWLLPGEPRADVVDTVADRSQTAEEPAHHAAAVVDETIMIMKNSQHRTMMKNSQQSTRGLQVRLRGPVHCHRSPPAALCSMAGCARTRRVRERGLACPPR